MTTFIDEVNISIDKAGLTGKHKVIYKVALRKECEEGYQNDFYIS